LFGEDVTGNSDQGHDRRALMEHPDRLKAVHMRHENIDNHLVERRAFQSVQTSFSTIGDDNRKSAFFKPCANCGANKRIVIDDENAFHSGPHETQNTYATDKLRLADMIPLRTYRDCL
jgi:hypothetical protein